MHTPTSPPPSRPSRWRHLQSRGAALGLAGSLAIGLASGWSVAGGAMALAFLLAAAAAELSRGRPAGWTDPAVDTYRASVERLGRDLLPVWSGHIEDSRQQMEDAVSALALRFGGIVTRLDRALESSRSSATDDGIVSVFSSSTQELNAVLSSLRAAMDGNAAMHRKVQSLHSFVGELQGMAEDVAKISAQTNLLAINAAIEAAHAGDSGRGFGIVSQEVRRLSSLSGDVGRDIAAKAGMMAAAIEDARASARQSAEHEAASLVECDAKIHNVLGEFRDVTDTLVASADALKAASVGIQSEIGEALVQMQFQDRVSQVMSHVRQNVDDAVPLMGDGSDGAPQPVDVGLLLDQLQSSYAMAHERINHVRGQRAPAAAAAAAAAAVTEAEEVTFF